MVRRVLVCVGAVALLGCGATLGPVGSVSRVESSGDKPAWLNSVPDEEAGKLFWVGRKSEGGSEDGVITDAREDCARQLADYLQNTANKLYEKGRTERAVGADVGSVRPYINDLFKTWYRKVKAQGLKVKQTYTEKYQKVLSPDRVSYSYKGYVLMTLDKKMLAALGQQALQEQLDKARAAADVAAEKALGAMEARLRDMEK